MPDGRGGGRLRRPRRHHGGVPVRGPPRRAGRRAARPRLRLPRRTPRPPSSSGPPGPTSASSAPRSARWPPTCGPTGTTMTVLVLVGDALADGPVARRSHLYAPPTPPPTACARDGLDRGPPVGPAPVNTGPHEPPLAPEVAARQGPAHRVDHRDVRRRRRPRPRSSGLLHGAPPAEVEVGSARRPAGPFRGDRRRPGRPGRAAVVKDAGDDPDVTNGAHLTVTAAWLAADRPAGTVELRAGAGRRHGHPARPRAAGRAPRRSTRSRPG